MQMIQPLDPFTVIILVFIVCVTIVNAPLPQPSKKDDDNGTVAP